MKSQNSLLAALQRRDEKAIRFVYWDYYASVEKYVVMNSGMSQDAEDVFQDAILLLLEKIRQPDFVLTSSLKTFLFSICKHLWLQQLEKKERREYWNRSLFQPSEFIYEENKATDSEAQWNSMQVVMAQITTYCSKLLNEMFLEGKVTSVYKNQHSQTNQKYKCLLQARKAAAKIKEMDG